MTQAQARKAELDTAWHHLPGRVLCHGLLAGLRWRGPAAVYGGPPRGAPFRAALGEHGAEAMAALLGAQPGVPAQHAAYFEALQHDLDALGRVLQADEPLDILRASASGFRGLLKTWRAARTWRSMAPTESHS